MFSKSRQGQSRSRRFRKRAILLERETLLLFRQQCERVDPVPSYTFDTDIFDDVMQSYWISQIPNDVEAVFKSLQQFGEKVLRIWGFNMVESTLAEPLNPELAFYQLWLNGTWYLNTGSNGLERFDEVVRLAEKYDVKLHSARFRIIPLTNNWEGYGSMDLYNRQITGNDTYHDVFYSDSRVVESYQRYVNFIVSRYKDSKAIFSWELANEPRCNGYPAINSGKCTAATMTQWVKEQSEYIKSIDPQHMVCIGDEGFFNRPGSTEYEYNGQSGMDFDANLQISTIDFGTFHLYPQVSTRKVSKPDIKAWGTQYIKDHIASGKQFQKPVVLEEFGTEGYGNKTSIYPEWFQTALDGDIAGIMPWQWGQLGLSKDQVIRYGDAIIGGASPNDGHTVYPNQTEVWNLFKSVVDEQNAKSG
ncbi:hypothetical protein QFC19_008317 [Naganishia cerealis]|uniref:Uncharacterized protein n=1 Tax=Naganishia cerealis TaxID=610337 RepID=A0ACC2V290_9TREE|nr:hypothetical protein QFC19_008317 [Naganishia cerealis]